MTWHALGWTAAFLLAGGTAPAQGTLRGSAPAAIRTQDGGKPGKAPTLPSVTDPAPGPVNPHGDPTTYSEDGEPGPETTPSTGPSSAAVGPASPPPRERILPIDPRFAPTLLIRVARTKRTHEVVLFDHEGRLRHDALAELRNLMSDPRSGIDHPVHWRLATLLAAVAAHFPGRSIELVSGYRHVSRHTDRSNHTRGRAIDMHVTGVDDRRLFDALRGSFADIGVGYYPNSTFVHLDVRDHATIWVDYSGPGQTPCYSRTPTVDLANGTVEMTTYEAAILGGCRKA